MSILNLIGQTPMVKLERMVSNSDVEVWAKLEGQNPGGSVKDRTALGLITDAMERRQLKKGDRIIEATSGNTGIAISMIAAQYGINVTLIMPENATAERVITMKAYGAEIILTPSEKTIEYSRDVALAMAKDKGYYLLNQFDNPANPAVHIKTTGPEIWKDTGGNVTHFVSSMGTTGTIMGTSAFLKGKNSSIQIIGAQPSEGSSIPGIRRWTPEFLPAIFDPKRVDSIMEVSEEEASYTARRMAKEEGIMGGMSSGGACHVALQLADKLKDGLIVFIVCDRGDRYLSSDLYEK